MSSVAVMDGTSLGLSEFLVSFQPRAGLRYRKMHVHILYKRLFAGNCTFALC